MESELIRKMQQEQADAYQDIYSKISETQGISSSDKARQRELEIEKRLEVIAGNLPRADLIKWI